MLKVGDTVASFYFSLQVFFKRIVCVFWGNGAKRVIQGKIAIVRIWINSALNLYQIRTLDYKGMGGWANITM